MDEPAEGGDAAGTNVGGGPCEDTGGSSGGETILMPTYKKYRYLHQCMFATSEFGLLFFVRVRTGSSPASLLDECAPDLTDAICSNLPSKMPNLSGRKIFLFFSLLICRKVLALFIFRAGPARWRPLERVPNAGDACQLRRGGLVRNPGGGIQAAGNKGDKAGRSD